MTQRPDGRPGFYYVTARNHHGRAAFLLGPFVQATPGTTAHRQALGAVRIARLLTDAIYSARETAFSTYGTARIPLDFDTTGTDGAPPVGKLARFRTDDAARRAVLSSRRAIPCRGCSLPMPDDPGTPDDPESGADFCSVCAALNAGDLERDPAESRAHFGG